MYDVYQNNDMLFCNYFYILKIGTFPCSSFLDVSMIQVNWHSGKRLL